MHVSVYFFIFLIFAITSTQSEKQSEQNRKCVNPVLPVPEKALKSKIGLDYRDSKPDWPKHAKAPKGAPNIVVILLDDVGFGQPSTFGGPIEMPTLDSLAKTGLRYTQFHTTALCSPTRAALLTGRNHHSVSSGSITETTRGYPGYTGYIPKSAVTIAEILRQNGYSTAGFGKWHNTPESETSEMGPFDRWPTNMGFEYFYGFLGGETSQWHPALIENTKRILPPQKQDYILTTDQANKAILWLKKQHALTPDKPFFLYYAPGAAHAPHHVPKSWISKFKNKFSAGWDEMREQTFKRQKKMGIIPPNTQLTKRPEQIPAWNSFTSSEKKLFQRMQEVFAAYLAHADFEIGRVINEIKNLDELDNTLIFYIAGDNGPSAEAGLPGTLNEIATAQGVLESPKHMLDRIDDIGSDKTHNNYPVGWAWAGSTPLKWVKQIASHFGGTRNGLVISWPKKITAHNKMRPQFYHVIDIVPTILEITGICAPITVNGITQKPLEGVSMSSSFTSAKVPSKHSTQYFEIFGNRAIYHNGWVAAAMHDRMPWDFNRFLFKDFDRDRWELYHIDSDFSEYYDLAKKYPKKLEKLKELWLTEAGKYNVLPLDDRFFGAAQLNPRTHFEYTSPIAHIPETVAPDIKNRSFIITADVVIPSNGAHGILVTQGGRFGGWALLLDKNKPEFIYNYLGQALYKIRSNVKVPSGKVQIRFVFEKTGLKPFGAGGVGRLFINNKQVAEGTIPKTVPVRFSADETFDVGQDTGTSVDNSYKTPFTFTGKLEKITIDLKPRYITAGMNGDSIYTKIKKALE